jgi:NADPH-dependent curcumin reductase CurA
MTGFTTRELTLQARPVGLPRETDIGLRETILGEPGPGQLVVRNLYLSLDPAIRDWMSDSKSYLPPIPLGAPVWCTVAGEVVASNSPRFKVGDRVWGMGGWADYSLCQDDYVFPVDLGLGLPLHNHLSVVGAVGMTAYYGLLEIGKAKAGETVLVSAAAGAVGSLVGQIARIKGCRVVGFAGSADKCRWITEELGFDGAINYKTCADLEAAIAQACPEGVDVYFDNVGGEILDATLMHINDHARIVFCGRISGLNAAEPVPGPWNMWQVLAKSARIEGFLISSYFADFPNTVPQMAAWVKAGEIQFREQIISGLESAPGAFLKLFDGTNTGKLIISLVDE